MLHSADIPDPRAIDGLSEGQAATRLKVHFRCVKEPDQLKSLLDHFRIREYTIEIRHNMYIIQTGIPLNQKAFVSGIIQQNGLPCAVDQNNH
jgi:hypothetical protein